MTNWKFDLQLFAGFPSAVTLSVDTNGTVTVPAVTSTGAVTTGVVNNATGAAVLNLAITGTPSVVSITTNTTTALPTGVTIDLSTLFSSLSALGATPTITIVSDGTNGYGTAHKFKIGSTSVSFTSAAKAGDTEATIKENGSILAAAPLTVNSGDLVLDATTTTANQATKLATASSSVTFSGTNAGTVTLGAYGSDTVTVTNGATGVAKISGSGNVTALKAGGTVVYTDADGNGALGAGNLTVQTADNNGTFTINTQAHTVATNTSNVTFTVSDTVSKGVTKITGLASGATDAFASVANVALTIGNSVIKETTGGKNLTITSNGTGISGVVDTSTGAVFEGIGMSGRTGYTINTVALTVSGDTTDGVDVTTATASTLANITGLSKNATLAVQNATKSAYVEQVTVTTDNDLVVGTSASASSSVTVNGVKYYAGRTAVNSTTTQLVINTTASGSLLTTGTVYLDGSTSKSIYIGDNTAAGVAATNRVKFDVQKGDVSVTALNGAYTVHDLDNGDSFSVSTTAGTYTYQVVNGVLYQINPTGASAQVGGNTLTSGNEGTYSLNLSFGLGVVDAITAAANAAREDNVYSSTGETIGETMTINLAIDGKAAVTSFVKGSTNYINSNNIISTSSKDAIGSITYNDTEEVFTYNASAKKQEINLTGDTNKWVVNGTSGNDTITGNGNGSTLNGGTGNDTITASTGDVANGGEGNDSLVAATADVTLSGGAGVDTLVAVAVATGTTTLTGGAGADIFVINDGTARSAVVTDFDFANDVLLDNQVATSTFAGYTNANVNADGSINLDGGVATVQASNGAYLVQVRGNDNKKQAIGWVGEEGTSINASSLTTGAVIIGNTNTAGDSLYGGSGADTIYGGAGDTVYGGAGKNQIRLSALAAGDETRTVGVGTGKDIVTGFVNGFDAETADKLFLVGNVSSLSSTLFGGTLNLKSGDATVQMNAATASSGGTEVLAGDKKAVFVASGATVSVSSASYADYYFGTKTGTAGSGLDASAMEEAVKIDLSNAMFKNFSTVTGGQGKTTLMGSSNAETLIAGTGDTSLYGGAGKDVLVGNSTAKDTYFMMAGGGNDTVNGFTYFNGDNADTADVVNLSAFAGAKAVSGGVQFNVNDTDKIIISGATADNAIGYQIGGTVAAAKIGSVGAANSFTYVNGVNYYSGGNQVDTLAFASGDSDNHQVWLDGSQGVTYNSVDVVDGSSSSGDLVLAGDSAKNTIIGGTGTNSLWGGTGNANDILNGGTGTNTFFFGLAEGKDTINCGTADDVVNLYNVTLDEISSAEITSSAVNIALKDGSSLTVNTGSRDIKFSVSGAGTFTANHNTQKWE